jgi:hypothetical protein
MLQLPFFTGAITRATAQCARLINFDNRACGGVVHEVDKLLVPPTGSILQLIEKEDNYTLLRKIIEVSIDIQWYNQNYRKIQDFNISGLRIFINVMYLTSIKIIILSMKILVTVSL